MSNGSTADGKTRGRPSGRMRVLIRRVFWTSLVCILLGWAVPLLVRVNYWKKAISGSLSRSLHRPVKTGDIRLALLGGIGFQIENVTIGEDPRFGIEPFARIGELDARLALGSLLRARVEFSSLTLDSPSINVVRNAEGRWNLEALWNPAAPGAGEDSHLIPAGHSASDPGLPPIHVEGGRINFKSGNEKRAFRIDDVALDLTPPATAAAPWSFRLEGTPARPDLELRSSSTFQMEGEFGPISSSMEPEVGVPLRAAWSTDQASLEDLLGLALGKDFGLRADASLHGTLAGTTSLLRVSAGATISNLHRWNLLSPAGESPKGIQMTLAGVMDRADDSLEVTSLRIPLGAGSVAVSGRLESLTGDVHPQFQATLTDLPLSEAAELVRRVLPRWDSRIRVEGIADGNLQTAGSLSTVVGRILVHDAAMHAQIGADPSTVRRIRFSDFPVLFQGSGGSVGPVDARLEQGAAIYATGAWNAAQRSSELHLKAKSIAPALLLDWAELWGAPAPPVWARPDAGRGSLDAQLDLGARAGQPFQITGSSLLTDAEFHSPRLNRPVIIASARAAFLNDQVKLDPLSATLGPLEVDGSIVANAGLPRLHSLGSGASPAIQFRLRSPDVDISALAGLIAPPPRSPFSWFAGSAAPKPVLSGWPAVQGAVEAGLLSYQGLEWKNVSAAVSFRGQQVELTDVAAELAGGTQKGSATISWEASPAVTLESRYANVDLQELTGRTVSWSGLLAGLFTAPVAGKLSGNLRLASAGQSWTEILSQWTGAGDVEGRTITYQGIDLSERSAPGATPVVPGNSGANAGVNAGVRETRLASFSCAFQIAQGQLRIAEMTAMPASSGSGAERKAKPSVLSITGTVGPQRDIRLTVQPAGGEGSASLITGTLAEPVVSVLTSAMKDAQGKPLAGRGSIARR